MIFRAAQLSQAREFNALLVVASIAIIDVARTMLFIIGFSDVAPWPRDANREECEAVSGGT
jgi:hypothetical protein